MHESITVTAIDRVSHSMRYRAICIYICKSTPIQHKQAPYLAHKLWNFHIHALASIYT